MVRPVRVLGAVLVAATIIGAEASAQGSKYLYLGGGATIPMGDYKEFAKTGWMGSIGLGTSLGSGNMFAFVDGFYGKNSHEGVADESTTLLGGGVNLGIRTSGVTHLYGYAGAGMQNHKYNPAVGEGASETKPYGRAAVGVGTGSGRVSFWAELGVLQGFGGDGGNTAYLPILAGISIGW